MQCNLTKSPCIINFYVIATKNKNSFATSG